MTDEYELRIDVSAKAEAQSDEPFESKSSEYCKSEPQPEVFSKSPHLQHQHEKESHIDFQNTKSTEELKLGPGIDDGEKNENSKTGKDAGIQDQQKLPDPQRQEPDLSPREWSSSSPMSRYSEDHSERESSENSPDSNPSNASEISHELSLESQDDGNTPNLPPTSQNIQEFSIECFDSNGKVQLENLNSIYSFFGKMMRDDSGELEIIHNEKKIRSDEFKNMNPNSVFSDFFSFPLSRLSLCYLFDEYEQRKLLILNSKSIQILDLLEESILKKVLSFDEDCEFCWENQLVFKLIDRLKEQFEKRKDSLKKKTTKTFGIFRKYSELDPETMSRQEEIIKLDILRSLNLPFVFSVLFLKSYKILNGEYVHCRVCNSKISFGGHLTRHHISNKHWKNSASQ